MQAELRRSRTPSPSRRSPGPHHYPHSHSNPPHEPRHDPKDGSGSRDRSRSPVSRDHRSQSAGPRDHRAESPRRHPHESPPPAPQHTPPPAPHAHPDGRHHPPPMTEEKIVLEMEGDSDDGRDSPIDILGYGDSKDGKESGVNKSEYQPTYFRESPGPRPQKNILLYVPRPSGAPRHTRTS